MYDIDGNTISRIYDIDGNVISTGGGTIVVSGSSGFQSAPVYKTVDGSLYRLVWKDEFDEADINKNFWTDQYLISRVTNRYQVWSDYYLSNSILHIRLGKDAPNRHLTDQSKVEAVSGINTAECNRLHLTNPNHHDVNPFWGLITQEGYYECRMKVFKATGGAHTAWWCVGIQDGVNALSPRAEIDITEIMASNTEQLPHGVHKQQDSNVTEAYSYADLPVDMAEDFHTIGFLWENGVMKWYCDGTLVDTKNINTPQYPMMHFLTAYKMLEGSGWDGTADPTLKTRNVEFQVDYLRIYKKATQQASEDVSIVGQQAIKFDASTLRYDIDPERGCPIALQSYVYLNWSDGTRTEHWVKWDSVNDVYSAHLNNSENFRWHGYVYGFGLDVYADITFS